MSNQAESYRLINLDDDVLFQEQLERSLRGHRLELTCVNTVPEYLAALEARQHDAVLLDLELAGAKNGGQLAKQTKALKPGIPVFMCSDYRDLDSVSACIQAGADDFIFKSGDERELVLRIVGSIQLYRALRQPKVLNPDSRAEALAIGPTMKRIKHRLERILKSAVTSIHVFGETGTGKELVSEILEALLPKGTPFIRVNCGAIAPALLESELFGSVKGAYTGAAQDKIGLIEAAQGGWIFLDEVALLSTSAQINLLRVLESHVVRRVGSNREIPVKLSVLSATNQSVRELIENGTFREDLWQRLCETTLELPALRERADEIPVIIEQLLHSMTGGPYRMTESAREILRSHTWKNGNIRELRNCLRAMTEMAVDGLLTPLGIPKTFWDTVEGREQAADAKESHTSPESGKPHTEKENSGSQTLELKLTGQPYERLCQELLLAMLKQAFTKQGRLSLRQFARFSGIAKSTLTTRLRDLVDGGLVSLSELQTMVGTARDEISRDETEQGDGCV